ncbi:MAG TPA: D-alanyl-D-alanine carboxypeptidase/D-alanyl-D-alanine-endopeptidase [Myxococcota bacterium]|nr:D-alanyl-D-alanine carboxypeptidase/D-alanyl-D-alanine-endopeptidase [Myxococcota bacterium]
MAVRIASWLLPFWVVLLFTGASSHGADLLAPLVDLQSDELTVSAYFALDGMAVAKLNENKLLNPASVTKIFTAAIALATLGADYTLPTKVSVVGKAPNAKEIIISTSGDPLLKQEDLEKLAKCVFDAGYKRANALKIVLDPFNSADVPPAFDRKSTDSAYRAGVAGFQVNRNAIVVSVAPGGAGNPSKVKVTPESDNLRIVNTAVTAPVGKRPQPTIKVELAEDGFLEVTVSGRSPGKGSLAVLKRVPNPATFAGGVFKAALRKAGVKVKGQAKVGASPKNAEVICERSSATVKELLIPVMHDSINPIAETMLRLVGASGRKKPVGFTEGARALGTWLVEKVGISRNSFKFTNGSGLYDANLASARSIVQLLFYSRASTCCDQLDGLLPVAGKQGTMKKRFKKTPLEGNLRAKTGTLDDVVSLAGSASLPDGRMLDFAVLINYKPSEGSPAKMNFATARHAIDKSVLAIWEALARQTSTAESPVGTK